MKPLTPQQINAVYEWIAHKSEIPTQYLPLFSDFEKVFMPQEEKDVPIWPNSEFNKLGNPTTKEQFFVIEKYYASELTLAVIQHLNEGWKLNGETYVIQGGPSGHKFFQAIKR